MVLIKPGELALKGLNRGSFEALLVRNIKGALGAECGQFKIVSLQSTFVVEAADAGAEIELAFERIKKVFGISKLALAWVCAKELEEIKRCCVAVLKEYGEFGSFKVEAKRADKTFRPDSMALCPIIGAEVLKEFAGVKADMHNPEVKIKVEVRQLGVYVYVAEEFGLGGLPVGCCGEANVLLSGGIDSPVAAFMMAKRGMRVNCTHFLSPPYTSELAKQKVFKLTKQLRRYCGSITLRCVELTKIQEQIKKLCPEELFTVILRRFMFRIAQKLALESQELALVTGESLGQVASQTPGAIVCTNEVCSLPVFRPLIGMDKVEVIERAKFIGTFETSILPYEDCCTIFVPKHPKTNPSRAQVALAEEKLLGSVLCEETGEVNPELYAVEIVKF